MKKLILSIFLFLNLILIAQSESCLSCGKIIFIVDNSGSVDGGEFAQMQQSISLIAEEFLAISPQSEVTVVQYAGYSDASAPGLYDITVPFTNDPVAASSWGRRFGMNDTVNDFLTASLNTMREEGVWETGAPLDIESTPCTPIFFVFTDALAEFVGSSTLVNNTLSTPGLPGFGEYNYLKTEYGAFFIVYHVNSGGQDELGAGAAIASVSGPYNGVIDPNPGDPEGSQTLPRQYYVGSFVINGTTLENIIDVLGNVQSDFAYTDNCTGEIEFFGASAANQEIISFEWDFGDNTTSNIENPVHQYPIGTYDVSLIVEGENGCQDTLERTIEIINLNPQAGANVSICEGESTPIGIAAIPNVDYAWSPNINMNDSTLAIPTVNPNSTTVYYLNQIGHTGCITPRDSVIVTVNPNPVVTLPNSTAICINNDTILGIANNVNFDYSWSPTTGLSQSNISNPIFNPTNTTLYTLTVTNQFNCESTVQTNIIVNNLPIISAGNDIIICENDSVVLNYNGVFEFEWIPTVNNNVPFVPAVGVYDYILHVTDNNGCENTDDVQIVVNPNPIAQFVTQEHISSLNPIIEIENLSTGAISYSWDFDDGTSSIETNPIHTYENDQIGFKSVELIAISAEGCLDTAYQVVEIEEVLIFYIPNSFTPNGDELNNTFKPVMYSGFDDETYHLYIFDRWGELIFESFDSKIGWDGTYHNRAVQDGTYAWRLEFEDKNHEPVQKNGHVSIVK